MLRQKRYSPGSLDTREKLVRALRGIPNVEVVERSSGKHHIMAVYQGTRVPIQESRKVRNPGHYARKIFKQLGLKEYLL